MDGSVVFVTATDYITVYSSMSQPISAASSTPTTLYTAVPVTNSPVSRATSTPKSHSDMPMVESSMPSPSPSPSTSTTPNLEPHTKPWNNHIASLSLAAVIFMAILLTSFLGYAIYQHLRGKCQNCARNETTLRKWSTGELKLITKDMVKARETVSSHSTTTSNTDLELGNIQAQRETTLAALTGPAPVVVKQSIWDKARDAVKTKPSLPAPSKDRFFTVSDVGAVKHPHRSPSPAARHVSHPVYDRAYSPPSPSVYSRPTNSVIGGGEGEFEVPEVPMRYRTGEQVRGGRGNLYSGVLGDGAARHAGQKRRSRAYGGLPDPEEFGGVDVRR